MLVTYRSEIAAALPRHVDPERMLRIALTSARKTPALLECTPESFLGAVIQSAQLGLEPDTPLGHAWLLPYRNGKTGNMEVNFVPGYRGYLDLIYRTKGHPILNPAVALEGDKMEYERGTSSFLRHVPLPGGDSSRKLTHAYAVAVFADGRKEFDVMTFGEVEACRLRSKARGFSPWSTDYNAMAMKTVLRRFSKYLPMSAELQLVVGLDDLADSGEPQHLDGILKGGRPIRTKAERIDEKINPGDFGSDGSHV